MLLVILLLKSFLKLFFDHLCPDSLAAWPVIQEVLKNYGSDLYFILHIFPLPYHRNAFFAAQGGLVVESLSNNSTWWQWLDLIFANQDQYTTPNTQNATGDEIIQMLTNNAVSLGISKTNFGYGMEYGGEADEDARINWKYATTRGVYGTPIFFLNGVWATDDSSWTYDDWSQLIESLLNNNNKKSKKDL